MTVITNTVPQKPQKQQKSQRTGADLRRSAPHGGAVQLPQKPLQPPQKSNAVPPDRSGAEAPAYFCGTSRTFCGTTPPHRIAAGQTMDPRISAVSAVSAAGVPSPDLAMCSVQPLAPAPRRLLR